MDTAQVKKEIEKLRREIRHHDYRYYVLSQPELSDKEYDDRMRRLRELEEEFPSLLSPDSPTQRVAAGIQEGFKTVQHRQKMLSLDNTYSFEELRDWDERVHKGSGNQEIQYVAELKIDGVSANLTYRDGLLVSGATRGDGESGEDVTLNIKTIRAIPLRLESEKPPKLIEIRGEVYLELKDFAVINKERKAQGEVLFANPRNAASGSLKLLAPGITARRNLNFFAHSLGELSNGQFSTQWEFLQGLKKYAMRINPESRLCKSLDEVFEFCELWQEKRKKLSYEIDGVALKVNSFKQRVSLGETLKSPRWAIAYKYPAKQVTTKVENIVAQVGRTGVITPVAELKPRPCGGVTIKHVTLHNFDEIERLGVKIGDTVIIERAGEVIPKVVKVVASVRTGKEKVFNVPAGCPVCNSAIVKEKEEEVAYRCINPSCPAQLEKGLMHFSSRLCMDIEGMGEAAVRQLLKKKMVKDFADVYSLKKGQLLILELFKDKKAENLVLAIENSKRRALGRLIYGLGIRHVGEKAAYVLAEEFKTLENLVSAKKEDLEAIYAIGQVISESVVAFFKQESSKKLIKKLEAAGVNTKEDERKVAKKTPLTDKTVVFTGELESFSRAEAEDLLRKHSGKASSNVSKETDFVVAGRNPGSKYDRAKKLGVKIIDEKEFMEMIR